MTTKTTKKAGKSRSVATRGAGNVTGKGANKPQGRGGGDNSGKGASTGISRGGGDNSGKGAIKRKK